MPQSIRMTVDLPEPFGPRNPKIEPFATENADVIDGREVAEPFGQSFALDHRLRHGINQENAKVERLVPESRWLGPATTRSGSNAFHLSFLPAFLIH